MKRRVAGLSTYVLVAECLRFFIKIILILLPSNTAVIIDIEKPYDMTLTVMTIPIRFITNKINKLMFLSECMEKCVCMVESYEINNKCI